MSVWYYAEHVLPDKFVSKYFENVQFLFSEDTNFWPLVTTIDNNTDGRLHKFGDIRVLYNYV